MNVSIRRQGINIKTVPITKDRARIGSGPDCEIQLTDPFLAPVVAEFVQRGAEWHLVDSGTSLEGVTRGGVRVIDEPVEPGQSYAVGAFELISNANQNRIGAATNAGSRRPIPMTVVEADLREVPRTVIEPVPTRTSDGREATGQRIAFQPVSTAPPAAAFPVAPRREGSTTMRRILLVSVVVAVTIVMGLAILMSGRKRVRPAPAAATALETASSKPATPAPVVTPPDGDALARKLEFEKAFAAWESQLSANPSASPELRRRVANGAFELARAYSAANDRANAARYFEIVVRYGQQDSEQVREARSRLQR